MNKLSICLWVTARIAVGIIKTPAYQYSKTVEDYSFYHAPTLPEMWSATKYLQAHATDKIVIVWYLRLEQVLYLR